jgi:hypothetical protein
MSAQDEARTLLLPHRERAEAILGKPMDFLFQPPGDGMEAVLKAALIHALLCECYPGGPPPGYQGEAV